MSELGFGVRASALTLRKRNKLIVAFARGVLVAQSAKDGGAMNAYRFAVEQKKPVATFAAGRHGGHVRQPPHRRGVLDEDAARQRFGSRGIRGMAAPALLFDVDGTLWDSYPWYAEVLAGLSGQAPTELRQQLAAGVSIVTLTRSGAASRTARFRSSVSRLRQIGSACIRACARRSLSSSVAARRAES